jgi:hypothetical protein
MRRRTQGCVIRMQVSARSDSDLVFFSCPAVSCGRLKPAQDTKKCLDAELKLGSTQHVSTQNFRIQNWLSRSRSTTECTFEIESDSRAGTDR